MKINMDWPSVKMDGKLLLFHLNTKRRDWKLATC